MYKMGKVTEMSKVTAVSIALVLTAQPAMAATDRSCITATEISALATVYAADLMDSAVKQCRLVLKKDDYLLQNQAAFVAKFAPKRLAAIPVASRAIRKLMKDSGKVDKLTNQILENLAPDATVQIFGVGFVGAVKLDKKTCFATNEIMETLAPLPAENLANLSTLLFQLSLDASPASKKSLNSCPFSPGMLSIPL